MRACLVVLLVCYLGAASVSALPNPGSENTTATIGTWPLIEECGRETLKQYLKCTENGTSKSECVNSVSLSFIECVVEPAPSNELSRAASPQGGAGDTIRCLFNVSKDLAKCIISGDDDDSTSIWGRIVKCLVADIAEVLLCF